MTVLKGCLRTNRSENSFERESNGWAKGADEADEAEGSEGRRGEGSAWRRDGAEKGQRGEGAAWRRVGK